MRAAEQVALPLSKKNGTFRRLLITRTVCVFTASRFILTVKPNRIIRTKGAMRPEFASQT